MSSREREQLYSLQQQLSMEPARYEQVWEANKNWISSSCMRSKGGAAILSVAASSHGSIRYEHVWEAVRTVWAAEADVWAADAGRRARNIQYSVCLYKSHFLKNWLKTKKKLFRLFSEGLLFFHKFNFIKHWAFSFAMQENCHKNCICTLCVDLWQHIALRVTEGCLWSYQNLEKQKVEKYTATKLSHVLSSRKMEDVMRYFTLYITGSTKTNQREKRWDLSRIFSFCLDLWSSSQNEINWRCYRARSRSL